MMSSAIGARPGDRKNATERAAPCGVHSLPDCLHQMMKGEWSRWCLGRNAPMSYIGSTRISPQ
jgi:hypothetical protein